MIDVKKLAEQAGLRTGDNLKFQDGYRYRSLGAPTNVKEQHLHQFAALVLEEAALEFDRRDVNAADGGPSEGWYEAAEPAAIIRAMKPEQS